MHVGSLVISLSLGLAVAATSSWAESILVFDNGRLNVVDTRIPADQVIVKDGPGPATTLHVVGAGGFVSGTQEPRVDLFGRSRMEMIDANQLTDFIVSAWDRTHFLCDGCLVSSEMSDEPIWLRDRSSLEIRSGHIDGVNASDRASVMISGGTVISAGAGLSMGGEAELTMTGGTVRTPSVRARSINISGGTFLDLAPVTGPPELSADRVRISGGTFLIASEELLVSGADVRVSGGVFVGVDYLLFRGGKVWISNCDFTGNDLILEGEDLRVTGGSFEVERLSIGGTGRMTGGALALGLPLHLIPGADLLIEGSGFNVPDGAVTATSGILTGFLRDGSPLHVAFERPEDASLVLRTVGRRPR